jgi:hypothetical protein
MSDPGQLFRSGALIQAWQGPASELASAVAGQSATWWLRGSRMRTKAALMDEWAAAAQFPPHFGATWDALRDALAELPEGGTFLVLEAQQLLRDAPPEEATIWLKVMDAVAQDLKPRAFRLILQAGEEAFPTLVEGLRALGVKS